MGHWTKIAAAVLLAGATSACMTGPTGRAAIEKTAAVCQGAQVSLYFEQNSAKVTREAQAVLKSAAGQTRGCRVDSVRVLGLADAPGATGANLELSKARAAAVASALEKVGLRNATFDVAAAGDAGAINRQGEAAPLRRRVDVVIAASSPAAKP
jgi:outer membrane protein OmpA-like peptidoglycan-associated protein